jgi:hypothetical protein
MLKQKRRTNVSTLKTPGDDILNEVEIVRFVFLVFNALSTL